MQILFLHPNIPDYAGDGLFHGLRELLGNRVVDYPRMDYMYTDYPKEKWKGVANEGKVLYGRLTDLPELEKMRNECLEKPEQFTCFIISNPGSFGKKLSYLLKKIKAYKHAAQIAWIDGSDTQRIFPFASLKTLFLNYPGLLFFPIHKGWYFKREFGGFSNAAPLLFSIFCFRYKMYPFAISIPEVHIVPPALLSKEKDFPAYIVDKELAEKENLEHGPLGVHNFVFRDESDYWSDIEKSRFGPTTKRGGWDALRHYEYAAKGAVLCFRNLTQKPQGCSPHGLNPTNSINYRSYLELKAKISGLNKVQYRELQQQTHIWICSHTTIAEASRFLDVIQPIQKQANA